MSAGTWNGIDLAENRRRMEAGELYTAFVPDLTAERRVAAQACGVYNREATEVTRRQQVEMLRKIVPSLPELPPAKATKAEDEAQLYDYPWCEPPLRVDYCNRISFGMNVFCNFNFTVLNTTQVTIGSRVLFGPNVSLFSGTHPLDPAIRNGTRGPEMGGRITIGDDCWFGGSVCVLPGVTIGRGVTVGAGSVVTKNVPPFVVVAGNPARILRKVESELATEYFKEHPEEEYVPQSK
ncbi:sugar O-acetyltransferase [Rhodotorula paludigena]|uniref:sugar O-acetyltransferase n=1 Tax=Rhodotorula paludigena TaxID=86838 RepID=UPI0031824023